MRNLGARKAAEEEIFAQLTAAPPGVADVEEVYRAFEAMSLPFAAYEATTRPVWVVTVSTGTANA